MDTLEEGNSMSGQEYDQLYRWLQSKCDSYATKRLFKPGCVNLQYVSVCFNVWSQHADTLQHLFSVI